MCNTLMYVRVLTETVNAHAPALPLQALWRGYKVRKTCGRASRDARRRIAAASAAVQPQRRIGVRTREALNVLLASKQCSQVSVADMCECQLLCVFLLHLHRAACYTESALVQD
jgi:hypothetical protein